MKQYVILFFSLLLIIVLHEFQITYLEKTSRYILTDITDIEQSLKRDDYDEAKRAMTEIEYTWENIKDGWDSFGEHDDVGEISHHIASLNVYTNQMERADALSEAEGIRHTINHIIQSERLKISNIL